MAHYCPGARTWLGNHVNYNYYGITLMLMITVAYLLRAALCAVLC